MGAQLEGNKKIISDASATSQGSAMAIEELHRLLASKNQPEDDKCLEVSEGQSDDDTEDVFGRMITETERRSQVCSSKMK